MTNTSVISGRLRKISVYSRANQRSGRIRLIRNTAMARPTTTAPANPRTVNSMVRTMALPSAGV